MFVLGFLGCDVVLMSMLRSIYIVGVGLRVAICSMSADLVASFFAGGDGWKCPNRFCILGYPVRSCIVSIGVFFFALYYPVTLCVVHYCQLQAQLYYLGERQGC
jgi:hypothetical protein